MSKIKEYKTLDGQKLEIGHWGKNKQRSKADLDRVLTATNSVKQEGDLPEQPKKPEGGDDNVRK